MTWRCGSMPARSVRTLTFGDYADRATRLAAGLQVVGVGAGDRVVMLIGNRPEFHVADVAVLLLGATPISIYNSSSPDQIRYLAGHARRHRRDRRARRLPRTRCSRCAQTSPTCATSW